MNRRPSRASKYHQQYLSFLRKWKNYVHNSQHQECEQLCLDHIDRIRRSIIFQSKQYSERHNGRTLDYNDSRFYDIKNYRSKVRNLYAVLLHDYLKQHSSALEQYELCVEDDPYNASAHYNWAILYKNYYKDYQSAEIHYRKAIDLKPTHAAYHNNYGLLLEQQLKKYESAREQFQMALDLDNNNGRAHTNMANLLKKHYTDYTTAQQHYEKAIALDPTNATRHFNYALFLKHNIKSFAHASNEYENALILEPQYFQAHNEYKNFLISESPFDRVSAVMDSKKQKKQMMDARHEHAYRCLRYSIHLLWQKKIRDAREIISMALKCEPEQPFAKLLNDPLSINTRNTNNGQQQKYKQLYQQKDNELYDLQQKLNSYQHQIQSICMKLKQSPSTMDSISIAMDQLSDDMNIISPHLSVDNDDACSTSPSVPQPQDAVLPPYPRPGSLDAYVNTNGNRIRSRSKHQSHMQIPNGIMSNSRVTRKRHSLISVSSAAEYNVKVMDVHKQTLLSAAHTLSEVVKDMNGSGNSTYANKMENVMHMILSTIRAWDLTNELDSQPIVGPHRLTAALIQAHSAGFSGYATPVIKDGGGLHPEDAYVAKTLGGMSMISQTSSAAMEQRRAFLTQAAKNPHVREAEKGIAKWLTTYMRTKTDTPRSMLSQSQLPFFLENEADDEEDDKSSDEEHESLKQTGVQNKIENCRSPTSKEFRVADRTLQWRNHAKIVQLLQNVNSWDFDVFAAVELAENYGMPVIFLSLCKHRHLITSLGINQTNICNYFYQISSEYKQNPFHNRIHGCDILVNCNYFLRAKIMSSIPPLDQLACLMAGATHDVGHPGNNNDFEIDIESDLAIQYNDKSVYENFHVSLAWQVLKRPGCNVLHGLSGAERKTFRQMMIRSILATDMTNHAEQQELLAELIDVTTNTGIDLGVDHELGIDENHEYDDLRMSTNVSNVGSSISRRASIVSISNIPANSIYADPHKFATVVIPILVHTADLSNPTKSKVLYGQWADRVMDEFWSIGDKQRNFGLPVTAIMDREKTDKPSCQIGFINYVVRPWFDLWGRLCKDKDQGDIFTHNVNVNFQWMNDELAKKDVEEEKKQAIAEKRKSLIDDISSSIDEDIVLIDYDAKASKMGDEQSDSDGSCSSYDDEDGIKHHRYSSNGRKRGSRSPSTKSHSRGSSNGSSDSKRKIKTRKFPMISSDARHSYSIQAKFTPEMNALAMHSNKSSKSKLLTKQVSFVAMTFEDMNKVQMMKRIQIIEELKQRTREFSNGVIDEEEYDEQDFMDDDSPPPINAENVDFEYNEYGNHPSVYVSEHGNTANNNNNQRRSEKRASSARSNNNKQRYFRDNYESNVLPSQTSYEYRRTISHEEHSNVNNVDDNSHQYSASYSQSKQGQQQRKIKRKISHKKGIVKKSHKRIAKERNPQPQVMGKSKNKNSDINMPAILESSHESPSAGSASQTSIL